jgi:hypothetical protein
MPRVGATTTQARNNGPRAQPMSPRSTPSAQTPKSASGSAPTTTASLNNSPSPCQPSNNGAGASGPPN